MWGGEGREGKDRETETDRDRQRQDRDRTETERQDREKGKKEARGGVVAPQGSEQDRKRRENGIADFDSVCVCLRVSQRS